MKPFLLYFVKQIVSREQRKQKIRKRRQENERKENIAESNQELF